MEKLKMHTADLAEKNYRKLSEMFPNAVTEMITGYDENGKAILERAIDADVLRQEISAQVVEGARERYQFTWPDKKKSVVLANAPIAKTLRLDRNKSVGKDGTPGEIDSENIYIEGDNLEALKLLQETYLGKVKMIYIDPPYNTGSDTFVYNDNSAIGSSEFANLSGQRDEEGNLLFDIRVNNETNGRFHTDWLNMLYPRLRIAKDLLSDDGIIFISIDENEVGNLRKICDEIFGAVNFIASFLWRKKSTSTNVSSAIVSAQVDYQICYAKSLRPTSLKRREFKAEDRTYPYKDSKGAYRTTIIEKKDSGAYARESMKFNIMGHTPREGKRWQIGEKKARKYEQEQRFVVENGIVKLKVYKQEEKNTYSANPNLLLDYGSTDSASKECNIELFRVPELFSNPKPTELLKHLILMGTEKDSIILDFFSGSATTAHAIMKINADSSLESKRKFILVQLPENCNEKSEAYKAGFKNICEIGEERIRRAGRKIKEEEPLAADQLDIGFRVFKVDSSNMQDVYYCPTEYRQEQLALLADNIKPDRTSEDLLFQVMLDLGILLSAKIEQTEIAGKQVFSVENGYLLACFDAAVTEETVREIAKRQPYYAVFRDSGMATDSVAVNFEQIFEAYSPKTKRKVL